jgi:hypothetical protein
MKLIPKHKLTTGGNYNRNTIIIQSLCFFIFPFARMFLAYSINEIMKILRKSGAKKVVGFAVAH